MPKGIAGEGKKSGRPLKTEQEKKKVKQVRIEESIAEEARREADKAGQTLTVFVSRALRKVLAELKEKEQNLKD